MIIRNTIMIDVFKEKDLDGNSVCKNSLLTASDGKIVNFFNYQH
jgi:hypothetical protein